METTRGLAGLRCVHCLICGAEVRTKILANHLQNKHSVAPDQITKFCSIQLERQTAKGLHQNSSPGIVKKDKKKDKSEKRKLKKRFQDSLRDQYLNLDVFTKMLMDVSFEYHEKRLSSPGEPEEVLKKEIKEEYDQHSSDKSDLKIRINLKEKKVMESNTKKTVKETFHLHQCSVCQETFKTKALLTKHSKAEHSVAARRSSRGNNIKDAVKNHPIQRLGKNKRSSAN